MLPDAPLSARRRRTALLSGTVISCGIAVGALLTGPHPNLLSLLALASVVIGNVAVVVAAWPATDGFLVDVRRERSHRGRNGGTPGLGLDASAGPAPARTGRQPVLRAAAPLVRATEGHSSPCWGGEDFIDHILAGGPAAGWMQPDTMKVLVYRETERSWQDRLSDHCPLSVQFAVPN